MSWTTEEGSWEAKLTEKDLDAICAEAEKKIQTYIDSIINIKNIILLGNIWMNNSL